MKRVMSVIILIMCMLCACNSTGQDKETMELSPATTIDMIGLEDTAAMAEEQKSDYEKLNVESLNIDSINFFAHITEDEIYEYSEQVKGPYKAVLSDWDIFPADLVEGLEEALYYLALHAPVNFKVELINSLYYDTIISWGIEDYRLTLEELCELFPEVNEHRDEISTVYEAYDYVGHPNCNGVFSTTDDVYGEGYYVFRCASGGTNGVNYIYVEMKNNTNDSSEPPFITICNFEIQNNGYGGIVKYQDSFYYVFLENNYELKIYDGIRIHKIGPHADTENISIKYLPQEYIWENVYDSEEGYSANINEYIHQIKEAVHSETYLENGRGEYRNNFSGDEIEDRNFILNEEYRTYRKIDYANTGIFVYIKKAEFAPSNYWTTFHLGFKFYIYGPDSKTVMELDKLEIAKQLPRENELVQLWFKEIDDKVFTFAIR